MGTDTTTVSPGTLRAEMVAKVRKSGYAQLSEVERALLNTHVMSSSPMPHWSHSAHGRLRTLDSSEVRMASDTRRST